MLEGVPDPRLRADSKSNTRSYARVSPIVPGFVAVQVQRGK